MGAKYIYLSEIKARLQDNTRDSGFGDIKLRIRQIYNPSTTAVSLRKDPGELPPPVGQALPGEKRLSWVWQAQQIRKMILNFTNLICGSTFLGQNQPMGKKISGSFKWLGLCPWKEIRSGQEECPSNAGSAHEPLGQIWPAAWFNKVLLEQSHRPIGLVLSMATTQSWVVSQRPGDLKAENSDYLSLTENVCQPLLWCSTAAGRSGCALLRTM